MDTLFLKLRCHQFLKNATGIVVMHNLHEVFCCIPIALIIEYSLCNRLQLFSCD